MLTSLAASCLLSALLAGTPPVSAAVRQVPADARAAKPETIPRADLFTGPDLSGWQPVGKGAAADWELKQGVLVCHGKGHTWLRSKEEVGDFHLRLEYQLTPGANSGVYVHVPKDGNHHRESAALPPAGFEIQILDDNSPRHAHLKSYQYSASLYDIAGASPRNSKPAGSWNTLEINSLGSRVSIFHNGTLVVDADPKHFPALALRKTRGYLGLQSHNGTVRFRNVAIGPARREPIKGNVNHIPSLPR